ncbi:hypothetical protein LZ198_06460 [Myxococcus sp. K15C18031901]|uniref:hypothetical protein n=1 Tax=Myxococcus dinghuensis TaxID=2906761 RepID=UPI0020A7BEF4|nr:hypothetical protein [Myxococcus dinghuensis]MCP3098519.1 hypothetical protein [Myxococcus dinghuensis]
MKIPDWKRPLLAVVVLSLWCGALAPRVAGAEAPSAVQPYVLSAARLYNDLEYEQALEQITRGKRHSKSEADDVLLSLYEGVILADLGRTPSSDAAFKAALFLQPDAKLPLAVSPKVSERFETVRAQVKRELDAAAATRRPETPRPPVVAAAPPDSTPAPVLREDVSRWRRAWVPAAIGGGLLAGAGVTLLLSRGEHSRLTGEGKAIQTTGDLKDSASRGKTYQTVSAVLAGAGVVGLGVAAGLYLRGGGSGVQRTELSLSTDGTSAFVSGRWP